MTSDLANTKTLAVCATILSSAAIVISICNLCVNYPRSEHSFDYLGLLVGILGLITTILLGWQIATTIITKERMSEMHESIDKVVNRNMYEVFSIQAELEKYRNKPDGAVKYYFRCLDCANRAHMEMEIRKTFSIIAELFHTLSNLTITQEESHSYCNILSHTIHEEKSILTTIIKERVTHNSSFSKTGWGETGLMEETTVKNGTH